MEWEKAKKIINSDPKVIEELKKNELEYQVTRCVVDCCLENRFEFPVYAEINLEKIPSEEYYTVKICSMPSFLQKERIWKS